MWQIVIQLTLEGGTNIKEKMIRTTHHQLYFQVVDVIKI
jgi:hypothetical protein